MHISNEILISSLEELQTLHPFYGITYLVCKRESLPIGQSIEFSINNAETDFLNHFYKPIENTEKFFRVFRTSEKNKYWLNNDYASSGSQATRTQMFSEAYLHPKNSNLWGWSENYINVLQSHLKNKKIPAYSLAFWILKDVEWSTSDSAETILAHFFKDFHITEQEIDLLFNLTKPSWLLNTDLFSNKRFNWSIISNMLNIPVPPDLPVEKGGALVSLEFRDIAPYKRFTLELSSRLNIITGDNSLGKSFVLECAWWALTGNWTGFPIYPKNENQKSKPSINFKISSQKGRNESFTATYNWKLQDWQIDKKDRKTIPGLVIYAQVDGAFAIWDPARLSYDASKENSILPTTLNFSREDVWEGLRVGEGNRSRSIFNGLITDWVHWQNSNSDSFEILRKVLKRLSPPDLNRGDVGTLEPGEIVRIPGESRPMPTIKHPYGEVPVTFASAAVKRIVALAYLIVWTWEEHKTSAKLMREAPQSKMVVIADEIESHLHPQWQRVILPSLTSVSSDLSEILDIQFLITTHSPLVMASIEPLFDVQTDAIFHLNLTSEPNSAPSVILEHPEFQKRGSADSWLISNIFDLRQPRSIEAELTIEEAKKIQTQPSPKPDEILSISKRLEKLLAPHDNFWIRWNFFAEKNGIEI